MPNEFAIRPVVGNYTLLNTFKNICEHQAYRRYIKRDQKYEETDAMRWGTRVHEALAERVGKKTPLPEDMKQFENHCTPFDQLRVECELELGITAEGKACGFFDRDVWFRGKVDNAVIVKDKGLLTEWKTGSSRFENPLELAIGAMLLRARYPALRTCVGRCVYLKEDKVGQMHDLSDFNATWQECQRLMATIADKIKTGDFVKRKSGLCGYCSVSDCENYFISEKRR
jgi:hypothetical protein